MNTPIPETENIRTVIRLDAEAYAVLEKELARPVVTNQTSAIEAGYLLGVQAALKALRNGYVIP